jgi:outer membrane immunogenic protein
VAAVPLLASVAFAADLPVPPMEEVMEAAPPAYDWSGFYVGINGGWGFGLGDGDYDYTGFGAAALAVLPGGFDPDADGGLVGGTVGLNWQSGRWVFGVEGDIAWSGIDGTDTFAFAGGGGVTPFVQTTDFEMDWFATARGRVGLVADRFLVYATGGAAFADVSLSTTLVATPLATGNFAGATDDVEFGWVAGLGGELGLTEHLTFKVEGLFYDLGEISTTALDPAFPAAAINSELDLSGVIARGGINWRF